MPLKPLEPHEIRGILNEIHMKESTTTATTQQPTENTNNNGNDGNDNSDQTTIPTTAATSNILSRQQPRSAVHSTVSTMLSSVPPLTSEEPAVMQVVVEKLENINSDEESLVEQDATRLRPVMKKSGNFKEVELNET
ncbi:8108_t:CDS:2 [Entrophospora sp. SA101]|nr:8273_t:CDS:2 [Entrophospora sp. SA101]CAJ0835377.1 8108_t:CDS:2 [Entrophospora sp. SA101]